MIVNTEKMVKIDNLNDFQDKINNENTCGHSCWEHSLLHCLNLMFLRYDLYHHRAACLFKPRNTE